MSDSDTISRFYSRWAVAYDVIARKFPFVSQLRRAVIAELELQPGDTVVEIGVGTGANLPILHDQVGSRGAVIGIDLTAGMLDHAQKRVDTAGWTNVHLVQADGTRPPIGTSVDAMLGTFVVGMFTSPESVVRDWIDSLGAGGKVALLDALPSDHPLAKPLLPLIRIMLILSTPPTGRLRFDESPATRLQRRVKSAHGAIENEMIDPTVSYRFLKFVRMTSGTVP